MARIADLISKDGASDGAAGVGANLWYAEVAQPAPTTVSDDLYVIIPDLHFFGGDHKFGPINWGGRMVPNLGDPLLVAFDNRQQIWGMPAIADTFVPTLPVPTGSITQFGGSTAPTGWLLCDGTAASRATYAALFAVIGVVYGAGNGTTTFNVPDLRGRMPIGKNAGTFPTLGVTGGEETHVLTSPEMPSHAHTFTGDAMPTHNHANTAAFTGNLMPTHSHANTASFSGNLMTAHVHTDSAGTPGGTVSNHAHAMTDAQASANKDFVWDTFLAGTSGSQKIIRDIGNTSGSVTGTPTAQNTGLTQPTFVGTLMATHTHSDSAGTPTGSVPLVNHSDSAGTPTGTVTMTNVAVTAGTPTGTNSPTGGGGAHNNLPPYLVVNHIIKT